MACIWFDVREVPELTLISSSGIWLSSYLRYSSLPLVLNLVVTAGMEPVIFQMYCHYHFTAA